MTSHPIHLQDSWHIDIYISNGAWLTVSINSDRLASPVLFLLTLTLWRHSSGRSPGVPVSRECAQLDVVSLWKTSKRNGLAGGRFPVARCFRGVG